MTIKTEEEITAGALAAVSAAIDSNGESTTHEETENEETGATAGDESADAGADGGEAGDGDGAGEGDEPAAEGEGEPTGETNADGTARERNADGTFKSKEQIAAETAAKPAAGAGDKPGEKPGDKKAPDAINDPIPKELKQETRARIETLIKTTKEVTAERDEVKQNLDYIVNGLQATGTTTQQYGEVLSFMALFNSPDPAQKAQALEVLEDFADQLSTLIGKERRTTDPVAGHADLALAMKNGQITREYAKQLAITRNQATFRTRIEAGQTQEQNQQQQHAANLHNARIELTALENTLRASDPNYEAKKAMIVPILKPIMQQLPPSQWKAAFEQAYAQAQVQAPQRTVAKKPVVPANQPLRANKSGSGGGGAPAAGPKSMLDAINLALGK